MADEMKGKKSDVETIKNSPCSLMQSCSHDVGQEEINSEDGFHDLLPVDVIPGDKKPSKCRPFFGICFAILSAVAVVLTNLFAKLCERLPVFEIGVVRFMIQLAITLPILIHANDRVVYSKKIMFLLILRAFAGTSGMLSRIYAVQNMPLGDATVLLFTTPVFAALFGRIILKEPLHRIYIFLLLLCLAGVTLIARPTFIFRHQDTAPEYDNIWLPALAAVNCAVITGFNMVLVRILDKNAIKSTVIIFYFGLVGLIYSVCGSYFDRGFQFPFCKSIDYVYAVLVGIFGYLVQETVNAALRFEKAFIVALGRTSGIVFGFVLQVLVFALVPSGLSFGGAALITLSNVIIFLLKWRKFKKGTAVVLRLEA